MLLCGGSKGGNAYWLAAHQFADAGYPSLSIGYFKMPGLPSGLNRIPIEYFAGALRWLGQQPGVDPHKMYVLGASREQRPRSYSASTTPDSCTA